LAWVGWVGLFRLQFDTKFGEFTAASNCIAAVRVLVWDTSFAMLALGLVLLVGLRRMLVFEMRSREEWYLRDSCLLRSAP